MLGTFILQPGDLPILSTAPPGSLVGKRRGTTQNMASPRDGRVCPLGVCTSALCFSCNCFFCLLWSVAWGGQICAPPPPPPPRRWEGSEWVGGSPEKMGPPPPSRRYCDLAQRRTDVVLCGLVGQLVTGWLGLSGWGWISPKNWTPPPRT